MKMNKQINQWLWMIMIWLASVGSLAVVSMTFRLLMSSAGFKS
jgi:hypothetical protein